MGSGTTQYPVGGIIHYPVGQFVRQGIFYKNFYPQFFLTIFLFIKKTP
jgi:uncharacterized membrane protein YqaE (UPF0057 family)